MTQATLSPSDYLLAYQAMKSLWILSRPLPMLAALVVSGSAFAQVVVPASPRKFGTRAIGSSGDVGPVGISGRTGGTPATQPQSKVVQITYVTLSDLRQWTTNDGKTFLGKLVAFEDAAVTTTSKLPSAPPASAPMGKPTVTRNGRIRFLIDSKPFETSLDLLSEPDRKLVQEVQAAVAAKSRPASAPKP